MVLEDAKPRKDRVLSELDKAIVKYYDLIKRLNTTLEGISRRAFDKALREVGIRRTPTVEGFEYHFLPKFYTKAEVYLDAIRNATAKRFEVTNSQYYISDYLLNALISISKSCGETDVISNLVAFADPRIIKRYRMPRMKKLSHLMETLGGVFKRAIDTCSTSLTDENEFLSCVAHVLEGDYNRIRKEVENIDLDGIEKELEELYKTILKESKSKGIEELEIFI